MMEKTNILLITSDQQHWVTLGVQNPEIKTPNLDRLAKEGLLFNRAYTVNPTCTPARASIITGMYPSQHGAWALGTKLPENIPTLGQYLQDAGYRTALIGKAHFQQLLDTKEYPSIESNPHQQNLDWWRKFDGPFYGFEHVELARNHTNEYHVGQHYALWMEEKGLDNWRDYFLKPGGNSDGEFHRWSISEEYHYDTWIAERTNTLMEKYNRKGEKFFLWASFPDPHPPYLIPKPWDTMYDPDKLTVPSITEGEHDKNPSHFQLTQQENPDFSAYEERDGNGCHGFHSHLTDKKESAKNIAVYYGMISLMDKYIGRILDKLDELGITDQTMVVFTTDHGHFFGQHGLTAKGAFHYEDMIKVPFIVRQPKKVPAGQRSDALQSLVDLAPSFLHIAGVDIPRIMTGIDQTEVWFGGKDKIRDHIIIENHHQPTTVHLKTCVDKRYKITVYYNRDYGEIFDLEKDPEELNNLWNDPECKDLKAELIMKLLFAEMGKEPIWMPRVSSA